MTEPIPPVRLGTVLVSLLDPARGEEVSFHRWYERDHFYAGCMMGPWFFAGRRFVATRRLKDRRFPREGSAITPVDRGSYLTLYFIVKGRDEEAERWAVAQVNRLIDQDRMLPSRHQAHAGFYRYECGVFRDPDGVPPELALDHPYAGATLLMVEREGGTTTEELLPASLTGTPVAQCLGLQPVPLPADAPAYVERPENLERRSLLLAFLDRDPETDFETVFGAMARQIEDRGLGRVSWTAPFIPTVPGTDLHTDDLW